MKAIYADEVFVLNLAVDYFILLATAKLCALPFKRARFGASAALGALYALAAALFPELLGGAVMKLLMGAAMSLVAFGAGRGLPRAAGTFFLVSAAFGGAVYAAALLAGDGDYVNPSFRVLLLSFSLCYFVLTLLFRRMARRQLRQTVNISVTLSGKTVSFVALKDTGNELYDPVSGLPVIVAELRSLEAILPKNAAIALKCGAADFVTQMSGAGLSFRLVPYSTLSSSSALLPVIKPERVTIDGEKPREALIGVVPQRLCADGEYSAVV